MKKFKDPSQTYCSSQDKLRHSDFINAALDSTEKSKTCLDKLLATTHSITGLSRNCVIRQMEDSAMYSNKGKEYSLFSLAFNTNPAILKDEISN